MSFFASNNRIYITNSAGKTIFDTAKPMPHVIQRLQKTISVTFPQIPWAGGQNQQINYENGACMTTRQVWACRQEYVCTPGVGCGFETVCGWETEWYNGDQILTQQWFQYNANEWSSVVEIGAVTGGLAADFLLVNAVATRTAQGALVDVGAIPCGLPLGQTFVANNSSILETTSDVADGQPWMTRIMSIYVENGVLKAEFKHSNRGYATKSKWAGYYCDFAGEPSVLTPRPSSPPSSSSAYSFNLDILVGKFTL